MERRKAGGCTVSFCAKNTGKCLFILWKKLFVSALTCYVLIGAGCVLFLCEIEPFFKFSKDANFVS